MPGAETRPSVSAIIPAHNAEAYVRDALDSVLAQTYSVAECIVIDDGSSDGTARIAREYGPPVRVIAQTNRGVSASRNRGAAQSRGELLAFLDADDRWLPMRLEQGVEALSEHPDAEAVLCATRVVDNELRELGTIRQDARLGPRDLLMCSAVMVSTSSNLLIRREGFRAIGGFDERLSTSADWALNYRLVERGRLVTLREPLVEYRRHGTNMSADVDRYRADMLEAFDGIFSSADLSRSFRRRSYANLHRMIAGSYFADRRLGPFLRHAVLSVAGHPSTLRYFLGLPTRRIRRRSGRRTAFDPHAGR